MFLCGDIHRVCSPMSPSFCTVSIDYNTKGSGLTCAPSRKQSKTKHRQPATQHSCGATWPAIIILANLNEFASGVYFKFVVSFLSLTTLPHNFSISLLFSTTLSVTFVWFIDLPFKIFMQQRPPSFKVLLLILVLHGNIFPIFPNSSSYLPSYHSTPPPTLHFHVSSLLCLISFRHSGFLSTFLPPLAFKVLKLL